MKRIHFAPARMFQVTEVELNPEGAKVGVEIRVVGNDSGEKLRCGGFLLRACAVSM